jgi:ribosomal protein S7
MANGVRDRSMKTIKTIAECLAEEIIAAEKSDG